MQGYNNQSTVPGIICTMISKENLPAKNYEFILNNNLPVGTGLGASAAFCVGVAAVILVIIICRKVKE